MSTAKLDRLYAEMMAAAQDQQRHTAEVLKCGVIVQRCSDEIKAECDRLKRAQDLNQTLRQIAPAPYRSQEETCFTV